MTADSAAELTSTIPWAAVLAAAREDAAMARVRDLVRVCETVITLAGLSGFNSMGSPRADAEALVFETLAIRDHSARYLDAAVTAIERTAVLDLLACRVNGPIPVPYLTGEAFFGGRRFTVRPGVFIPRSALGALLDDVLAEVRWSTPGRALELGCGSGALGLSVAMRAPEAQVDLVDIDPLAVTVTAENIQRHRLVGRAHAMISDLFAEVDRSVLYDLVVANLPYVPEVQSGWSSSEIDAEPSHAIFRPDDGLDLVRTALAEAQRHLSPEGLLVLEVGTANEDALRELLAGRGRWWTSQGRPTGVVSLRRGDLTA